MNSLPFRTILNLLVVAGLLTGCRSASYMLTRNQGWELARRLPTLTLELDAGPLIDSEGALPEDPQRVFETAMRHNIIEAPDSNEAFGYAKLQITEATVSRGGKGFQLVQMMTMLMPSVLGVPLEYRRTRVTAELQVLDAQGNLLGTYAGSGQSNIPVAMYYGYSQAYASRLADVEALRQAIGQIQPQVESHADSLRRQLRRVGPI